MERFINQGKKVKNKKIENEEKKEKVKNTYRHQKTKHVTYIYSKKEAFSLEVNTKGILNFWGNGIGARVNLVIGLGNTPYACLCQMNKFHHLLAWW